MFLSDINYKRKRGDTRSNRVKPIRKIETSFALPRRNPPHHIVDSSSEETDYESGEEISEAAPQVEAVGQINNINIIKDIRNYYKTETNNYNKKLSRYKNYIKVAEIAEIVLSSLATTATTTSVALTGIGLPYSIPTAFATATVCGSLSKTINTKIRNKIIKYSQMYILSKQFSDKFIKRYTKSMKDNKIPNDENNELVKVYEEYKKNKKNKLSIFLN